MIIATLVLLLLYSFCLSATEAALFAASRVRIRYQATTGGPREKRLSTLVSHRDRTIAAVMILNHLCNLGAFALITRLLAIELGARGYVIAFLVALPIYLIGLEVFPKAIARRRPYRVLLLLLPLPYLADKFLGPLLDPGGRITSWLERVDEEEADPQERLREEFKSLTDEIVQSGTLGEIENRMIHRLIDSRDTPVGDVLVPLSHVTAVPLRMPVQAVLDLARENDFEHFPVMDEEGRLVGAIDVFDILLSGEAEGTVALHLRKLPTVTSDEPAPEVLYRLRSSGSELAAVVDEEGEPLGVTCADDLASELLR